jgi:hypothetical protein
MGRSRWMLIMAAVLLATGATLARPGVFLTLKKHSVSHTTKKITSETESDNPLASEVGWHWRNGGIRHWRACLLQQH